MSRPNEPNQWFPHRMLSMPRLVPVVVFGLICFTPAVYLPAPVDPRAWFYENLTGSSLFALKHPVSGERSLGVIIWDWAHVMSVVIAQLVLIFGLPIFLWFSFDLLEFARRGIPEKVQVAQLLVSTLVGGIAINIFLSTQLPRLVGPRVVCSFLIGDATSTYLELIGKTERFNPQEVRLVHIRITNVGTIYYSGFTVSCSFPGEWRVPFFVEASPDEVPPRLTVERTPDGAQLPVPDLGGYARGYRVVPGKYQIDFPPQSDPRDTGPGSTALFQFFLLAPSKPKVETRFGRRRPVKDRLTIKISANEAGGTAIRHLNLWVDAKPDSDAPDEPKEQTDQGARG